MIEKIRLHIKNNFSFLDEDMQQKLIDTSLQSLKEEIIKLEKILKTNEKEKILNLIHKIKGLLLNTGLIDMAENFNENDLNKFQLNEIKEKTNETIKEIKKNFLF